MLTDCGPPSEIANFFHLPAALIVGEQKHLLAAESDVKAIYSRIKEKYRAEEVAKLSWDNSETSLFQIYPYLVLIKTIVITERVDGVVAKRWTCSYLAREARGAWKFDVVTAIPN